MKKRTRIILASVLAVSVVGGVAAHNKMRNGGPGDYMKYRLTEKLELNDTQADKLDAVTETAHAAWNQFRETRAGTMEQVMALLQSEQFNQDEAMELVREKTGQFENQAEQMVAAIAGFTDSLDESQKQELQEMLQYRMEHRGNHRKHGGKHGHDGKWEHGEMEYQVNE